MTEAAWPLLDVVRNASKAEGAPKQERACVKEHLKQEREMRLARLASDVTTKLDKQENEREVVKAIRLSLKPWLVRL